MRWWMIENIMVFISIVTENLKRRLAIWCILERLFRNWHLNSLIYLWLCWVFVATPGLYLVAVCRLPLCCLLLLWSMGFRAWASVVGAHNSKACGILLVQGSTCESVPPELSGRFFTTRPPGKFNNWNIREREVNM